MPQPQYLTVAVGQLRKNPWNSNQVDAANEEKIRESIKRNGIFKPIIVRQVPGQGGFEIIGGEHRWEQAVELGYTDVPVVDLGEIDDRKAKEIGVIDNARYGIDDTLSLGEILKDIGVDDLQDFLPYGDTDLTAIFSASDIALDDLEIDESFEKDADPEQEDEKPVEKAPKTHTVMRFKLSLGDAERLTTLVAKTQKEQGLTTEDDLTNAGDALVHLLGAQITPVSDNSIEDLQAELDMAVEED
ncbi:ParB/RepB/Spo0J family partition protein [Phaeobacter gallaeciensis]|uniref:ParB/RepB/Spo0J family partition protein n=1 Tax=Phaeobacter gallaeciensis TaxID=60890 RepID=UPI002380966B|nr:ParB/RepB/Spo0J family partition protein [Phaeobacter gallaeciensis]MDE4297104.1 ParB/RepB/Spo0J family partition protein [Phaeobacter gallaeciensis]